MPSPWKFEWWSRMDLWLCHQKDHCNEWEWDRKLELAGVLSSLSHKLLVCGIDRTSPAAGWRWMSRIYRCGKELFPSCGFLTISGNAKSFVRPEASHCTWPLGRVTATSQLASNWDPCFCSQFLLGPWVLFQSNLGSLSIPLVPISGRAAALLPLTAVIPSLAACAL